MTSENKSPIDGHWRGYYQTIEDQMAGRKNNFKVRFNTKDGLTVTGQMIETIVITGEIAGSVTGDAIKFTKQTRTDVPRSVFEGTIGADGALSGQCQIGSSTGTRSGKWHAERYQPGAMDSFFDGYRRAGVVILLVAAFTLYFGIVEPITLAHANEKEIAINSLLVKIFAVCAPMGTAALIFGAKANQFLKRNLDGKRSVKGWILMVGVLLLSIGLYEGLLWYLRTLGYEFPRDK
ncbi:MAG: hypothetical protein U0105_14795 [Candidatus Obscuribacterales bacterium]